MIGKRNEIARLQSDFYRNRYRLLLRTLSIALIIMIGLILFIAYSVLFAPRERYYANTTDGRILTMPGVTGART